PPPDLSLGNISRAMDAAHSAGVPVIVVQHGEEGPDASIFQRGSSTWKLHPEVDQRPRDHLVEKTLPGAFTGTPLERILADGGVEGVAIIGYMTHMCVDTTARQAAHSGYTVEILSDATDTLALENAAGTASGEE